jgi:hypothetical protein
MLNMKIEISITHEPANSDLGAVSGEFKPAYEYVIKNIKQGDGDFRSKILYATVERIGEGMVCSATVDFILRMYYGQRDKIENYEEVLTMFLDFYDKLIRRA